jgi:hypothetical protein
VVPTRLSHLVNKLRCGKCGRKTLEATRGADDRFPLTEKLSVRNRPMADHVMAPPLARSAEIPGLIPALTNTCYLAAWKECRLASTISPHANPAPQAVL